MAAISVVTYGSPHKILQQSNNTNRNDIMIVRKTTTNTNGEKTTRKPRREITRVSNPTPIAVARRNARERNRVKQVNNGFAALRQHIPPEIAAAFEQQVGHGRSGNKKLSKVETLRMAVEYIRSLEEILSSDDSSDNAVSSRTSTINFPSPKSNSSQSYSFTNVCNTSDDQNSNSASPKTFQYIRISEQDTYEIITPDVHQFSTFEDEENIQPIVDNLSTNGDVFVDSPLTDMVFESYGDEHSLSPSGPPTLHHDSTSDVSTYIPTRHFTTLPPIEVLQPRNIILSTHPSPLSPKLSPNNITTTPTTTTPQTFHPTSVITSVQQAHLLHAHQHQHPPHSILYSPESDDCPIKLESPETDLGMEQVVIKSEQMIDVIDWWGSHSKLHVEQS